MSDELLIKTKPEFISLASEALKGCPKLLSESGLRQELNKYADAVAVQAKDFKSSAAVRECLENPDSKPKEFQALLAACKFKYLTEVFAGMAQQCSISANGMFSQALNGAPYKPVFALPDNEFGAYLWDQLESMYVEFGILKDGEFTKQHIKPERQGKIIS